MAQQTAVKLLLEYIEQRIYKVNQLDDGTYFDENIYMSLPKDEFEKIKEQAKEMEEIQIVTAYQQGCIDGYEPHYGNGKNYYRETFNK